MKKAKLSYEEVLKVNERLKKLLLDKTEIEESLREQKMLFETMFNTISEGVVITNTKREILLANKGMKTTFGYAPEDIIGKSTELLYADTEKYVNTGGTIFNKDAKPKENWYTTFYKDSNNKVFPGETFGSKLYNTKGEWIGNVGIMRNISERINFIEDLKNAKEKAEANELMLMQQQDEIKKQNNRLESLLRISQLKCNSTRELLDYALDEAINLTQSKIGYIYFYSEEKREFILNTWSKNVMKECMVMNPQTVYELDKTGCWGEAVRQRKPIVINNYKADNPLKKGIPHGHVVLHKFLTVPVIIGDEIVAVAGVANKDEDYNEADIRQLSLLMDSVWKISERISLIDKLKRINEKLQISENETKERLKELNGIYNVGLLTSNIKDLDRVLKIIVKTIIPESMQFDNDVYVQLKIGDKTYANLPDYKLPDVKHKLLAPIIGHDKKMGELIVAYTKDLPFIDVHEQKLIDTLAIKISSAIERYQYDKDLKESESKLKELNATKDKFFSILAHDLKNPFISILGFSDLLVSNIQKYNQDKIQNFATQINNVAKNTFKLLENLLEWAKTQSSNFEFTPENFLFEELVNEVLALSQDNAKAKEIVIEHNIPEKLKVYADKNMLATVMRNLISNAIKFTSKGGVVNISATNEQNNIQVTVSDTGIGIDKKTLDRLFKITEKISTPGTANEKGTGLGLILCKEFVEKHGGKIWVESELENPDAASLHAFRQGGGGGSKFKFTLPDAIMQNKNNSLNYTNTNTNNNNNFPVILVADDEEYNYLLIKEMLYEFDYELIHAINGKEAIDLCQTNQNLSLVLMDIKMPIVNGYEAAEKIKKIRPKLPIIAQSAYAFDSEIVKHKALFNAYLTKPLHEAELQKKVMKFLERK